MLRINVPFNRPAPEPIDTVNRVVPRLIAQGNIVPGDIIQAVEGHAVPNRDGQLDVLERFDVGDKVRVTVWRNGEVRELAVGLDAPRG